MKDKELKLVVNNDKKFKRVIRYHSHYKNDGPKFSDCSTNYTLLPILVDEKAGPKELKAIAKKLKLRTNGGAKIVTEKNKYGYSSLKITHAVPLQKKIPGEGMYAKEKHTEYLGYITLPNSDGVLPLKETLNNKVTKDQAHDIVNLQEYGVSDCGETVDKETVLVKSGWNYYHEISVLGYDLDSFQKVLNITEHGFEDDTSRCDKCGLFNTSDDGYSYNFRSTPDSELLGIECGCFDEYTEESYEDYANNDQNPIELSLAQKLQKQGKIIFVERFIGGMTDGRGGHWHGDGEGSGQCNEGNPETVLEDLLKKHPKNQYLFTHDESGQFQTYFSVWELVA